MRNRTDRELDRELYAQEMRDRQAARDDANTASGLMLGVLIAVLAGLAGLMFFLTQRNDSPTPVIQQDTPDINVQPPTVQPPEIDINIPEPQAPVVNPPENNAPAPEPVAPQPAAPDPAPATQP